jgi:hypothetical protein
MGDRDFVQVVATDGQVHIINIQQIACMFHTGTHWCVVLAANDLKVGLDDMEAEKLIRRLPGARPTKAGSIV